MLVGDLQVARRQRPGIDAGVAGAAPRATVAWHRAKRLPAPKRLRQSREAGFEEHLGVKPVGGGGLRQ